MKSARAADPAEAKKAAESAARILDPLAAQDPPDCDLLIDDAEAQLRAMRPADANATLDRATKANCATAPVMSLKAWALEFNSAGVRRGPGADLHAAMSNYVGAALLFSRVTPVPADYEAGALGTAAELAELLGDREACRLHAWHGLQARPSRPQQTSLALDYLRCSAAVTGEGAAVDRLGELVGKDALLDVVAVRLRELKARLDKGHDDPVALTSVAYYALLADDDMETHNAEHYLVQAAALDEYQPEMWYLMGRAHENMGKREEAADNYRRQIKDHPGTSTTRLAVNELANVLADMHASRMELEPALKLLDDEIEKTPDEASLHDTKGKVLASLGRRDEAIAEYDRAFRLSGDKETEMALKKLRQGS